MLLEGKKLLVTGVLMDSSIAFHVAKLAQEQGAEVVLTSFGRTMKITSAIARRLPTTPPVVELDVTSDDDLAALADRVREHVPHLDGVVHSIGFAPQGAFNFMEAGWDDVATAVQVSAYSLASLTKAALPLMSEGGSVVGLTFDARFAWPVYDWMGVAKAAFESTNRYLARDLGPKGIRCNIVAAGPIRTTAAKSIPGFERFEEEWGARAPLGWDVNDAVPAARACVRAAVRLVPRHDRRDGARRRRLPRDGRLSAPPAPADEAGSRRPLGSPGEQRARGDPRARPGVDTREVRLLEGPNLYFPRPAVKVTLALPGYLDAPVETLRSVSSAAGLRRGQPGAPGSEQRQQVLRPGRRAGGPGPGDRGAAPAGSGVRTRPPTRPTSSSARSSGGTAAAPRRSGPRSGPCSPTSSPGRPLADAVRERAAAVAAAPPR